MNDPASCERDGSDPSACGPQEALDGGLAGPGWKLPPAREWAAAHVHSRAEKAMARILVAWKVPCFVPTLRKVRFYGIRRREHRVPLFSGYVFFDQMAVERQRILATRKVARIIQAPDPTALRRELEGLCIALANEAVIQECRFGRPGSRVMVKVGPLQGLEGELVRFQGKDRLVLSVHLIGRSVLVDVEAAMCEPA